MNIPSSEYYSSGCESGWTMYLDQTSNSNSNDHQLTTREDDIFFKNSCEGKKRSAVGAYNEIEEEDEDLSMVSDASSGPPHFQTDTHFYAYASPISLPQKNKSKHKISKAKPTVHSFCIDDTDADTDTATSPIFNITQINNVAPSGFSQVLSDANIEGESIAKKHLGFFKSSTKGKSSLNLILAPYTVKCQAVCWEERGSRKWREYRSVYSAGNCSVIKFKREGLF